MSFSGGNVEATFGGSVACPAVTVGVGGAAGAAGEGGVLAGGVTGDWATGTVVGISAGVDDDDAHPTASSEPVRTDIATVRFML